MSARFRVRKPLMGCQPLHKECLMARSEKQRLGFRGAAADVQNLGFRVYIARPTLPVVATQDQTKKLQRSCWEAPCKMPSD